MCISSSTIANQPVHQFMLAIYHAPSLPGWLALTLAVILVVLSRSDPTSRNVFGLAGVDQFIHTTPQALAGGSCFLGLTRGIALILMEANMFDFPQNTILRVATPIAVWPGGGGGVGHRLQQKYLLGLSRRLPIPP